LGGSSVFRRRNLDRFGVGYFNYGLSDVLKNALLAPPLGLRVGNEAGAEVFYNYALTRWLRVTADMQVLPPTIDGRKTLVFGALRLKVSL
jgi:porin